MNNTNAYIRFRALDACLRDKTKKYYYQDLLNVVNTVLYNYDGSSIQLRQLLRDLEHMDRDALLGKEIKVVDVIERKRGEGGRIYCRYKDPEYSMFDRYLTDEEATTLKSTIELLKHFKGMPQFGWLDETLARLKEEFRLEGINGGTVRFSHNPYLEGMKWYGQLFDAIVHQEVLELTYHRFGRPVRKRVVHPYQLRQWNYRWYLIGYEDRKELKMPYVVIPIDRIERIVRVYASGFKPQEDEDFDFDRYFKNIVGVSLLSPNKKGEKPKPVPVVAKVHYPNAWYVETKPIHRSQQVLEKTEPWVDGEDGKKNRGYMMFQWDVIPNEELVQALIVYADQVEIVEPEWVRLKIIDRAKAILINNGIR